jgi:poly-gamma-glutamate synthesis protein (capsule biosynthesis protein)
VSSPATRRRLCGGVAAALLLVPTATGCRGAEDPQPAPTPSASAEPRTGDTSTSEQPDPEPEPPEPPEPRSVTVALTGDVLVHNGVWQTAERDAAAQGETVPDFAPMFTGLEPLVAPADLAICHLETPVSRPRGPYLNYPVFSAPPSVLDGLVDTGYDACTTASNHSVDTGFTGLVRTIDALDARGLAHTGTYAERRGAGRPLELEVDGVRIGLISMTFGINGLPVTEPWSVNLIDVPRALAQAEALHRDGVDVVMVAIHAGTEYLHEPNEQQLQVFADLTASPYVDFVYGHHAHVVQPFDRVNGTWVLYGLGNMVAQQEPERRDTFRGIVARLTLTERPDGEFEVEDPRYAPTLILNPTTTGATRVLDVARVRRSATAPPWLRLLARQAARSTDEVMARPGVQRLTADGL